MFDSHEWELVLTPARKTLVVTHYIHDRDLCDEVPISRVVHHGSHPRTVTSSGFDTLCEC